MYCGTADSTGVTGFDRSEFERRSIWMEKRPLRKGAVTTEGTWVSVEMERSRRSAVRVN